MIPGKWNWPSSSVIDALCEGDVHVWLVVLKDGGVDRDRGWQHLSEPERKQAVRYTHEEAQAEYVVSRAVLRILLAGYVEVEPGDLSFFAAPGGKPYLNAIDGRQTPRFNMTHSRGVGVFAFSIDQEVGVDVEFVNRHTNHEGVAKRFFTEREASGILGREAALRKDAFARTWTCKEACLKWTGMGLRGGLKTHEIVFGDDWRAPVVEGVGPRPALIQLAPADGWIGALALDRPPQSLKTRVFGAA